MDASDIVVTVGADSIGVPASVSPSSSSAAKASAAILNQCSRPSSTKACWSRPRTRHQGPAAGRGATNNTRFKLLSEELGLTITQAPMLGCPAPFLRLRLCRESAAGVTPSA